MKKRYYWIKITEKFINSKYIKGLRSLENGADCVIIYLKMLTTSLEDDGMIYFDNIMDSFEEELALELDEDVKNVQTTLNFLKRTNLIEYNDDEYFLTQTEELTGSESESAARVRKCRAKKQQTKTTCNADETLSNKNVTLEKETDLEKDKELDIDKDIDIETYIDKETNIEQEIDLDENINASVSECIDKNLFKIKNLYEENIGTIYPTNTAWFIEVAKNIEPELFKEAIIICINKNKVNHRYLSGIIKSWIQNGISTMEDYEKRERVFWGISSDKKWYSEAEWKALTGE